MRQATGIFGFIFTNGYLAYIHFQKTSMKHCDYKIMHDLGYWGFVVSPLDVMATMGGRQFFGPGGQRQFSGTTL